MKNQALFSSKDKSKILKCCLLQFLFGALRVKSMMQSSRKPVRVYRTEPYKMIKMYLKIQDIFTRPNEFIPDMSGGQTEFRED